MSFCGLFCNNLGSKAKEVSFYTNDGNLTKGLQGIFDEVYGKCGTAPEATHEVSSPNDAA